MMALAAALFGSLPTLGRLPVPIEVSIPGGNRVVSGSMLVVRNGSVVAPTGPVLADVSIDGGMITSVGGNRPGRPRLRCHRSGGRSRSDRPSGERGRRARRRLASRFDVGRRRMAGVNRVTAYLPTVITGSDAGKAIDVMVAGAPSGYRGAIPVGLHLEGPFLATGARGTHPEDSIRPPSVDDAQSGRSPVWWRW